MFDKPKARPIDPGRKLADLYPSRFLKPEHIIGWKVTSLTVTIARLVEEEVTPKPGQPAEYKPVLYFLNRFGAEHPQGYLISAKIDAESLSAATGAATVGDLAGKQITIQLSSWKSDTVLRISPVPPTQPDPK